MPEANNLIEAGDSAVTVYCPERVAACYLRVVDITLRLSFVPDVGDGNLRARHDRSGIIVDPPTTVARTPCAVISDTNTKVAMNHFVENAYFAPLIS